MKQKALILESKPLLARHYEDAVELTYKRDVFVGKKYYRQFLTLESQLHTRWIYPKDYAFGVCDRLSWWVAQKGFTHLPMNTFCGQWAIEYFEQNIGNRKYKQPTTVNELEAMLLQDELSVARLYIEERRTRVVRLMEIVEELREILSPEWLKLYEERKRVPLIVKACDVFSWETGHYVSSYEQLVLHG